MIKYVLLFIFVLLSGCASNSPEERIHHADALVAQHGWVGEQLPTGTFTLAAYMPAAVRHAEHLTIYFEGDGQAYLSISQPSDDPTPKNPVALTLAVQHPNHAVAYLARPCQYVRTSDMLCQQVYWTEKRFSPEVVVASDHAVEMLKQRFGARYLTLVGYSGGGAVAALIAAQRSDVIGLITVAGNLDHAAWTREHRVSPLIGSINPAEKWRNLAAIPQIHLVGEKDQIMGVEFAQAYRARFPANQQPKVVVIPTFDHSCCWARDWPNLMTGILRQMPLP